MTVSLRLSTGVLAVPAPRVERPGVIVVPDTDARLCVDPNTDSIDDGFGEGNSGTGESGARTASMDAVVNREDEETSAAAVTGPSWSRSSSHSGSACGAGFATRR
jgi:hypothetical protein